MTSAERFNGERLRQYRRMSKQALTPKLIQNEYSDIIAEEIRTLLQKLTDPSCNVVEAVRG